MESDNVFKEDWLKTYSNKKKAVKQYKNVKWSFTADNRKIKQSSYLSSLIMSEVTKPKDDVQTREGNRSRGGT